MGRKPDTEKKTKLKMIEAGTKLFFENGFDGTSIRGLAREVGCEVGLFYYYYDSKDALYNDVIVRFFDPYKKEAEILVDKARKNPYHSLFRFFGFMREKVSEFREKYAKKVHASVRYSIREQALTIIDPYIEEIIKILVENGAKPIMNTHLTAVFLSHGVGSIIIHAEKEFVDESEKEVRKTVNTVLGINE